MWTTAALLIIAIVSVQLILAESLVFLENRYPKKTQRWLIVLGVFPVAGFILYLLMGLHSRRGRLFPIKNNQEKKVYQSADKEKNQLIFQDVVPEENQVFLQKLIPLITDNAASPLTLYNQTIVLTNGREKFRVLQEELERANYHIHMEYYIFRDDDIGKKILEILIRKSRQGVQVRLLVDGAGSKALSASFFKTLHQEGIETGIFFPIRFPYLGSRLNYRNHRKIVVIDGKIGFFGGMNIGDEYLSRDQSQKFWRDTHFRIEGEAVLVLQKIFLNDWNFTTKRKIEGDEFYPVPKVSPNRQFAQIIASGPDGRWDAVKQAIFLALSGATTRVHITTPYLVPDESMVMMLQTIALSGIEVKLLVQGVPDHRFVHYASQSYYQELLEAGVKIYQYHKGILHAKIVTIDDNIAFIGSANFDIRSFEIDLEVTAAIYDPEMVERLEQDFKNDLKATEQVELSQIRNRGLKQRLLEAHARLMAPLL